MTVDLAIFQCLCILGHHGAIEISFIIIIIYAFSFKVVEVAIPKFRTPLSIWSHLFRGAGHEKRRGEQLKWSLAFRLYMCTATRTSSYSPVGPSVFIVSLGFFVFCVFVLL